MGVAEGRRALDAALVLDVVQSLVAELDPARARRAVGLDDSLTRELGLGSLERVELLLRLEQKTGISLPRGSARRGGLAPASSGGIARSTDDTRSRSPGLANSWNGHGSRSGAGASARPRQLGRSSTCCDGMLKPRPIACTST